MPPLLWIGPVGVAGLTAAVVWLALAQRQAGRRMDETTKALWADVHAHTRTLDAAVARLQNTCPVCGRYVEIGPIVDTGHGLARFHPACLAGSRWDRRHTTNAERQ